MLKQKGMRDQFNWYIDAASLAGKEFGEEGRVSSTTMEILGRPLMEIEAFVGMANVSWDGVSETASDSGVILKPLGKGVKFLTQMKYAFNKNNNLKLTSVLEFEFTDTKENAYFTINSDKIEITEGVAQNPDLKIITTFENWMKISNGEVEGAQAMMDGLYRCEGDMSLMMKMETLFGSDSPKKDQNTVKKKDTFYGLKGDKWMTIGFIPWT
ncbi:MAG: SCP2 sterol-binding domain-containing protein, partial [Proteobacteria bacterium]|nr:SCP2 sterol-binding domain-containing protein [Pseudomonadota bacterium]